MVRETSISAYNEIKNSGLLSPRRFEIWDALLKHNNRTANEVFREIKGSTSITQANMHARLNELREMGMVIETLTRECSITKNVVIEWRALDDRLPKKLDKKKPKDIWVDPEVLDCSDFISTVKVPGWKRFREKSIASK